MLEDYNDPMFNSYKSGVGKAMTSRRYCINLLLKTYVFVSKIQYCHVTFAPNHHKVMQSWNVLLIVLLFLAVK